MKKMVYSNSLDEKVVAGFTVDGEHFTWNDGDCVYWSDDVDDEYYEDVPKNADVDEEEDNTMTREEKLRSMRKEDLLTEAAKLGLKLSKKTKNNDIVDRILEAEKTEKEEETMNKEITREDVNKAVDKAIEAMHHIPEEFTEPAPKKERKARTKKTFESLLANVPVLNRVSIQTNGKKRNAVHIQTENGKRRIFGYDGAVVVVTNEKYLHGLHEINAEKKNYGWRVEPTAENMLAIQRNYLATLA